MKFKKFERKTKVQLLYVKLQTTTKKVKLQITDRFHRKFLSSLVTDSRVNILIN